MFILVPVSLIRGLSAVASLWRVIIRGPEKNVLLGVLVQGFGGEVLTESAVS